jgi:hypothetical protein
MKIYFAGNFPVMKNPELEKQFRDKVLETQPEYRRLISYYYEDDIQNLIEIKKEETHGRRSQRTDSSVGED